MTMLDRMRRHKGWLKWSLAIVVLAFILLYIPELPATNAGGRRPQRRRRVRGRPRHHRRAASAASTSSRCRRTAPRTAATSTRRLLKQLGIDQRIVQQMIEEETALAEADAARHHGDRRGGPRADPALPGLQENGHFIGDERYRQLLQMQNPPMRPDEFEEQVRRGVDGREAAGGAHRLDHRERQGASTTKFKRRNEKVKLAVVAFPADKFREGVDGDATPRSPRTSRSTRTSYKIPEKRKVRYALVDMQGDPRPDPDLAAGHPALLRGQPAAVLDAGTGARQPHPAQDRRQGRSGREEAGRGPAGEGRRPARTSPQLATKYSRGRSQQGQGRRPRLLRQGADGAGVRQGRVRAAARDRSATS